MLSAEELKKIFESKFDPESWKQVLTEVFGLRRYYRKSQEIDVQSNDWEAQGFELVSFETIEGRLIGVYEVQISQDVNL